MTGKPRLVVLESPHAPTLGHTVAKNVAYTRECMRDCFQRGETPFASHLLYPGALDDTFPDQRKLGMEAGFAWGSHAELVVVYVDLGISRGMIDGFNRAQERKARLEFRELPGFREWEARRREPPPEYGDKLWSAAVHLRMSLEASSDVFEKLREARQKAQPYGELHFAMAEIESALKDNALVLKTHAEVLEGRDPPGHRWVPNEAWDTLVEFLRVAEAQDSLQATNALKRLQALVGGGP